METNIRNTLATVREEIIFMSAYDAIIYLGKLVNKYELRNISLWMQKNQRSQYYSLHQHYYVENIINPY